MIRIAVVGCGGRVSSTLSWMVKAHEGVTPVVIADPDEQGVRSRLSKKGVDTSAIRFVPDVDRMLELIDGVDGVMIGTRCYLHTPMAVKVAQLGVPVLLEKPVGIDPEQLESLAGAYRGREDSVVVSFPLRASPIFGKAEQIVRSGRLGTISQLQAVNNVPYGSVYYESWYRNHEQTGDLWLQKATHDLDYITHLMGGRPQTVAAMESRTVFGGDMPAGITCDECDRTEQCLESPLNRARNGHKNPRSHECFFGEEIRHHDSGSALVRYANGAHAAYCQNFVVRHSARRRGAMIIGYRASLSFDFTSAVITVWEHHRKVVDEIRLEDVGGHFGGDELLIANFVDVVRGEARSKTTLADGLLSAAMCLAAGEACRSGVAQPVVVPGSSISQTSVVS